MIDRTGRRPLLATLATLLAAGLLLGGCPLSQSAGLYEGHGDTGEDVAEGEGEGEGGAEGEGEGVAEGEGVGEGEGEGGAEGEGEGEGGAEGEGEGALRGFNEPCSGNGECASGFCVHAGDGDVCTRTCADEDCPVGWACKGVTNFGSDLTFLCAPVAETLCEPCRQASDCGPLAADLCLEISGDHRCARDCSDGRPCPQFYECQAVEGPGIPAGTRQCLPVGGRCGCTVTEVGTTRPCAHENLFGRCQGIEICDAEDGWVDCTAATPRAEECDGLDNDCDEHVDEELGGTPCEITNGFGTCLGRLVCDGVGGKRCEGTPPSLEVCDGIDNDCQGGVDDGLCFDGNGCTRDICTAEGCTFPPLAGACDDGSVCTTNDHCVNSACAGAPVNCDDNNPCTDDRCDPVGGCQHVNNAAPCEAGNLCTSDVCQNGECRSGGPVNCDDGNPCTNDTCAPDRGCQHGSADGRPCDDDDPCSAASVCGGTECVATQPFCTSQCGCAFYTCLPVFGLPICTCLCP